MVNRLAMNLGPARLINLFVYRVLSCFVTVYTTDIDITFNDGKAAMAPNYTEVMHSLPPQTHS